MEKIQVRVIVEPIAADLPLPFAATEDSAGADLRAALEEPLAIPPGEWRAVNTGLRMEIPCGYEGQVRPRSGLASKFGVTCLNTPGTIDADYRGIVMVLLINLGKEPFIVNHGERIAQLVLAPVTRGVFMKAEQLDSTVRGDGGFGHTGVK